MMKDVIVTQNLTKMYGDKAAVSSMDMHVKQGDIYGFIAIHLCEILCDNQIFHHLSSWSAFLKSLLFFSESSISQRISKSAKKSLRKV